MMNTTNKKSISYALAFFGIIGENALQYNPPSKILGSIVQQYVHNCCKIMNVVRENETNIDYISSVHNITFVGDPRFINLKLQTDDFNSYLQNIDGKFACWCIEQDCSLFLGTDILGAGAIYYHWFGNNLYFATHLGLLIDILPNKPGINRLGLVSQLLTRQQLFDETHFKGIFRIESGSFFKIKMQNKQSGRLKSKRHKYISMENIPTTQLSEKRFNEYISENMKNTCKSVSAIMLSGGLDSWCLTLNRPDSVTRSITYGTEDSYDINMVKEKSKLLEIDNVFIPYDNWTLNDYFDLVVKLNRGCSGLETIHNLVAFKLSSIHTDAAYVGYLGDALTGKHHKKNGDADLSQIFKIILINQNEPLISKYFKDEKNYIVQYLRDQWNRYSSELSPTAALMLFDLKFRQGRWISQNFDLCAWYIDLSYPFLDRKLIAASMGMKKKQLEKQSFYKKAIKLRESEMGRIKLVSKNLAILRASIKAVMKGHPPVYRLYWPDVIKRSNLSKFNIECGYNDLDMLTRDSISNWDKKKGNKQPFFFFSAPIAASFL